MNKTILMALVAAGAGAWATNYLVSQPGAKDKNYVLLMSAAAPAAAILGAKMLKIV